MDHKKRKKWHWQQHWQDVNCPILIIYGKHDVEIPISNSQALFRHALNSTESVDALVAAKRVVHTAIPNEANVYYAAAIDRSSKPRFMLVELIHANHNNGMMIELSSGWVHVRLITIFIHVVGYFDYTYESIAAILR